MKRRYYFLTGLASIQVGVLAAACAIPDVCVEFDVCGNSGAGGTGGSSSSGMSTSSTGIDPTCDPHDENYEPTSMCGVFVNVAATNGDGTPDKPFGTLAEAVMKANEEGKPLYVCGTGYTGEFTLENGVGIFGGLTCEGWKSSDMKSKITGVADKPVLRVMSQTSVLIDGVDVVAVPAVVDGGSSIAVIVGENAIVAIENSTLTADNGKKGTDGVTPAMDFAEGPVDNLQEIDHGLDGASGNPANTTTPTVANPGGPLAQHPAMLMPNCVSAGGKGGDGGPIQSNVVLDGSMGLAGIPAPSSDCSVVLGPGCGGKGETGTACADGLTGDTGVVGQAGDGASGLGLVSVNGFAVASGTGGEFGLAARGGGGGGGARGTLPSTRGASGGAGGIGGCGGLGATPGQGGGASIGLIALGTVTFDKVVISVGTGGNGGDGKPGQPGFFGWDRGPGPGAACDGGKGGRGGAGGASGGGRGGHAVPVVYVEAEPTGFTVGTKGSPGEPGATPFGATALAGAGSDTLQVPMMQ